jgi:cardiolipin synthase
VLGGPDRRNEPISKSIVSLLNEASDRVWIATGYFVPDDVILAALELAASRGVDVRLLISEKNDHPWLVTVGRSYYGQLLAAGVRIFEYSVGINHAKIMLADDTPQSGTANSHGSSNTILAFAGKSTRRPSRAGLSGRSSWRLRSGPCRRCCDRRHPGWRRASRPRSPREVFPKVSWSCWS